MTASVSIPARDSSRVSTTSRARRKREVRRGAEGPGRPPRATRHDPPPLVGAREPRRARRATSHALGQARGEVGLGRPAPGAAKRIASTMRAPRARAGVTAAGPGARIGAKRPSCRISASPSRTSSSAAAKVAAVAARRRGPGSRQSGGSQAARSVQSAADADQRAQAVERLLHRVDVHPVHREGPEVVARPHPRVGRQQVVQRRRRAAPCGGRAPPPPRPRAKTSRPEPGPLHQRRRPRAGNASSRARRQARSRAISSASGSSSPGSGGSRRRDLR